MPGLTYEQYAEVYEMRHGSDYPTPWKLIARRYPGTTVNSLCRAISRLETKGLNRDANGAKPLSRVTQISSAEIDLITRAKKAGYSWPAIAARMNINVHAVKSRWHRWRRSQA